jgi:hypothetical protein
MTHHTPNHQQIKYFSSIALSYVIFFVFFLLCCSTIYAQERSEDSKDNIPGFSFLEEIVGQWEGPVMSTTPAGSFDIWYVDFRPVSESQVSQYSNMDAHTINYTSFFIVKYSDELRLAMRTEGVFMGKGCVTYEILDSADEKNGYYLFSDFKAGPERAYTEFIFREDKLTMQTYTNKFGEQESTTIHSRWEATLADRDAAKKARKHFKFPQPIAVKDFTDVFADMKESIYFNFENDPYPSDPQPYVGSVTVKIKIDKKLRMRDDHELFVVLSTKPIFEGLKFLPKHLKYFSKYAFLSADTRTVTLKNVHPGKYFLYAYNDVDGDKKHWKGDYISSDTKMIVDIKPESNTEVEAVIDMVIP